MFRALRSAFILITILGLITTNILTMTSTAFNSLISSLIPDNLGVRTIHQKNTQMLDRQRAATQRMGNRTIERTKRSVVRVVRRTATSWIPFVGTAVAGAYVVIEAKDMCDSLRDLDELYSVMEISENSSLYDDTLLSLCQAGEEP